MKIVLHDGREALIDDADAEIVSKYKWWAQTGSKPYPRSFDKETGKAILLHRLIAAPPSTLVVDHINGDVLDNRRSNLRACTHAQNLLNSKTKKDSGSGIRNVEWRPERKRWRATVRLHKKIHRKEFASSAEAEAWATAKRKALHGEFAFVAESLEDQ